MNPGSSRARLQLRSRVRAQVSDAILDAAEELFAARGVGHTPLAAIAKRAGVAVGTLYNYHADRDALVHALFESRRAQLIPQIKAIAAAAAPLGFEPRVRAFVSGVLALFDANRRFIKIALENEHMRAVPGSKRTVTTITAELETIIAAGIGEGRVAPAHAELAPRLIGGALKAALLLRVEQDAPMAADAELVVGLVLRGVLVPAPERGRGGGR